MITAFYHPGYAAPIGEQHIMPMRKFALVAEDVSALAGIRIESPQPVSERKSMTSVPGSTTRAMTRNSNALREGRPRGAGGGSCSGPMVMQTQSNVHRLAQAPAPIDFLLQRK